MAGPGQARSRGPFARSSDRRAAVSFSLLRNGLEADDDRRVAPDRASVDSRSGALRVNLPGEESFDRVVALHVSHSRAPDVGVSRAANARGQIDQPKGGAFFSGLRLPGFDRVRVRCK